MRERAQTALAQENNHVSVSKYQKAHLTANAEQDRRTGIFMDDLDENIRNTSINE